MASSSSSSTAKHPYPSEVNVGDFVFIKLSSTNYFMWSRLMLGFIESQGLIGFIKGTTPSPPKKIPVPDDHSSTNGTKEIDNPEFQDWKRSDALIRRWILSTLNDEDVVHLVHSKTAKDIWKMLETNLSHPLLHLKEKELNEEAGKNLSRYLPLHNAALTGNWDSASEFLAKESEAVRAIITGFSETALMVAVRSPWQRKQFLKKLVELMSPDDLAIPDRLGLTGLHIAAGVGNIEAAKLLVDKNPGLPNVWDNNKTIPLHIAAGNGQRKLVTYLLAVTKEDAVPKPFEGESGVHLMHALIFSGFFDIAQSLLQSYPKLASGEPCPLLAMVVNRSSFHSGTSFNFWQHLIYSNVPIKLENNQHRGGAVKNFANSIISVSQKLHEVFWKVTEILVPQVKNIREKKLLHNQALHLLKCICQEVVKLDHVKVVSLLGVPIRIANHLGTHEVIEEVLESFPGANYLKSEKNETIFHHAILYRRANVFNIIYQFEESIHLILSTPDLLMNNGLHMAGRLMHHQRLNLRAGAPGAALQMQRELQWYKEVEKFMLPRDKEQRNTEGKTPAMVFTETHEELVKEGEQWIKDTAKSCTIVATLVATIVFAAAITVPGGNNSDTGFPIFSKHKVFIIFAVSDALALFSSISSTLMFLSILTSRYAEGDFLYALPKRLSIGLLTLFLSIISMMLAFGATLYLVFGDRRAWITLVPVVALTCLLPVSLFASLQFPLFLVMIKSTYFPSIFGKQSDRILF